MSDASGRAHQCLNASNPSFSCTAKCFCDSPPRWSGTSRATYLAASCLTSVRVRKVGSIISTDNITYSETFGLMLHMFEPPVTDKRKQRPAMVMIHGPCQPCR